MIYLLGDGQNLLDIRHQSVVGVHLFGAAELLTGIAPHVVEFHV